MPLMKKINNLREIRLQKGLSGYDLQILSNIPAQLIYLIERGLRRPQHYERNLLSVVLKISEKEIFPDELMKSRPEIISTKRNRSNQAVDIAEM